MGSCFGKPKALLAEITDAQKVLSPREPRWSRITEVSQETDSRQSFAGVEPEPLRI